ncbi:MAG: TonB-dependent receptor [Acidobacteria bacterium]|nr:TonB-dependent receptor [Acidobacteriota bacterium]
MKRFSCAGALFLVGLLLTNQGRAQSLGAAGTVAGTVTDATGRPLANASVTILNRLTSYRHAETTDDEGAFRFTNVPPNSYHMEISAPEFATKEQDLEVRSAVPVDLGSIELEVAGVKQEVTVEAAGAHLLENVPYAHNDIDMQGLSKLPVSSPGSNLSDAITLSSGAVAADSNGFFHPLGDHAQTSFSVDGQPISDQQSKAFSTQIPLNAIQSTELITGAQQAEYGDKTSLVVNAVMRSGLGRKPTGSLVGQVGSFGTYSEEGTYGLGNEKVGNFLAFNMLRSGRFLDTPEFSPVHAIGNNGTLFDRFDYSLSEKDALHLNIFAARNWFQVPNTYDQPNQDQRQKVQSFNVAPGYQRIFGSKALLTVNAFARKDWVNYYPSRNGFDDTPLTFSQHRTLMNWGGKADWAYFSGRHNLKVGMQAMQTRLGEQFSFGITDPFYNPVCVDASGDPQALPSVTNPDGCAAAGFQPNPGLLPGLPAYDLTRGGSMLQFAGSRNVNQLALFAQDSIKFGNLQVQAGLRMDVYRGIVNDSAPQPRIGFSYLIPQTGTVLRASYTRTFETPYNENLVFSSASGVGGLTANALGSDSVPLHPGRRNQFNAGLEQAIGNFLVVSADYFWKYTTNAFDFGTVLNTPLAFPISLRKSKLDGLAARIGTPVLHGFQWQTTFGHTRSRYFGPQIGGLVFNNDVGGDEVFRIDHDQAFQQTTQLRYQQGRTGPWVAFTWRYDSGLVAGEVTGLDDALGLTGAQQAAIGMSCGAATPSVGVPLTADQCTAANFQVSRLSIPDNPGDDHNPPRVAPRHVLDIGVGTDNLFHADRYRTTLKFAVTNLTNTNRFYNFLSTFSGTHFVQPRSYQAALGFVF